MNYWERRQKQLSEQLEKDEEKLKKRLSSFYDTEYRKLEKEIAAYYSMYGEDKVIKYRNLMQNLSDDDKERLIKRMQEFVQLYPGYADLLPVRKTIYKLNRLEGLQMSVLMQQYEIGAVDNEEIRKHLEKQALRNANAAAETMGYGKNFYTEDSNIIKAVVDTKWCNGKDFSERIWGNVEKLAQYLSSDIAAGFARGDSYEKLVRQLRQRFGKVSRNDAYRLIYTEGTYVMNEARAEAFRQDTEEYIFRVQYDKIRRSGWRDICDDLNEKVFRWDERKPGINFPPMHAWCHCTATPYVSDRQKFIEDYENRYAEKRAEKVANRFTEEDEQEFEALKKKYKSLEEAMLLGSSDDAMRYKELQRKASQNAAKNDFKTKFETQNTSEAILNSWRDDPRTDERDAISSYSRNGYLMMNDYLRHGNYVRDVYKKDIEALEKYLDKSIIKSEIFLKRGTDMNAMNHLLGDGWNANVDSQIGKIISDKGFLSTTPYEDGGLAGSIKMYIKAPKGTKGAYIKNYCANENEKEFLLQHGTKLEIKNIEVLKDKWGDNKYIVHAEVVVNE